MNLHAHGNENRAFQLNEMEVLEYYQFLKMKDLRLKNDKLSLKDLLVLIPFQDDARF